MLSELMKFNMPLTTEQFKAAVEDARQEMIQKIKVGSPFDELERFTHRIISLTADMFVGEKIETSDLAQNEQEQKNLKMYEAGRNIRIEEERALAEELKKL